VVGAILIAHLNRTIAVRVAVRVRDGLVQPQGRNLDAGCFALLQNAIGLLKSLRPDPLSPEFPPCVSPRLSSRVRIRCPHLDHRAFVPQPFGERTYPCHVRPSAGVDAGNDAARRGGVWKTGLVPRRLRAPNHLYTFTTGLADQYGGPPSPPTAAPWQAVGTPSPPTRGLRLAGGLADTATYASPCRSTSIRCPRFSRSDRSTRQPQNYRLYLSGGSCSFTPAVRADLGERQHGFSGPSLPRTRQPEPRRLT